MGAKNPQPFAMLLAVAILLLAPSAFGAGGSVSGTALFYQNQGNYCPGRRTCTGANYLEPEYHTYRPLRGARTILYDQDSTVIGQGSTDGNGNFTISWYSPTMPTSATIRWRYEHVDGRFRMVVPGTETVHSNWAYANLVSGANANQGVLYLGSSAAPIPVANIYDGAFMEWDYALR